MPKHVLYKYRCKELFCNQLIRSDKWNKHCEKKHFVKFKNGTECKKEIIQVRESSETEWKKFTQHPHREKMIVQEKKTDQSNEPLPSTSGGAITKTTSGACNLSETEMSNPTCSEVFEENDESLSEKDEEQSVKPMEQLTQPSNARIDKEESDDLQLSCDPADYAGKKLSAEIINFLLSKKKEMSPANERGRAPLWTYQEYPDGSTAARNWLVQSKKNKSLFCLPCLIFGGPMRRTSTGSASHFAVDGYSDWVNVSRDIKRHESSTYHTESHLSLIKWNSNKGRIDSKLVQQNNYWVNHNRAVLSVVINCTRFLTQEMMAFRNSKAGKGKLFNLFKLLAKYDADARAYLERLEKNRSDEQRMRVNFLAFTSIQNLVCIMRDMVIRVICKRCQESGGKYSIIMDSTQDASRMESTVLVIRYIEGLHHEDDLSIAPHPTPVERLLSVFTSKETSGLELHKRTKDILQANNLEVSNIVGQSYDGAGNMRGSRKGMKTLIQKDCPQALYTWCTSHRFSLVVEKSVENCGRIRMFFDILDELYVFMHWSHRRHASFVEVMKESAEKNHKFKNFSKQRLKRIRTTRWDSKQEACKTLKTCFSETLECLEIIEKDKNTAAEFKAIAAGLKAKMFSFDFIVTLEICVRIFDVLAPTTTVLQGTVIDFGSASTIIAHTVEQLKSLRNDESWVKLKLDVQKLCAENGIRRREKRVTRKKRFFDEYGLDYHEPDEETQLKVDVYYAMIDSLLMQINERFQEGTLAIMNDMRIFSHENLLKDNGPTKAEHLCTNYKLDVKAVENEFKEFKRIYRLMEADIDISDILKSFALPKNLIKSHLLEPEAKPEEEINSDEDNEQNFEEPKGLRTFILSGYIKPFRLLVQLRSQYKNLFVLYKILLTLAMTSCSAERAFSKQKIIKNPIRSSMLDSWMAAMMILASEKDILDGIGNDEIIDKVAESSKVYSSMLHRR